ncbi:MAG: hypothetical protein Q7J34_03980 [Bacteroidales bacterium]|jgi:hypothetical protein|nr:hypothetical protein [Bacteroidales bacterium]
MENIINYPTSYIFSKSLRAAGVAFIIAGGLTLIQSIIDIHIAGVCIGLLFLFAGIFLSMGKEGFQLNSKEKKFRLFFSLFSLIKIGKWLNIQPYTAICLLSFNYTETTSSQSNRQNTSISKKFEINLLNSNQSKKLRIMSLDSEQKALQLLEVISVSSGIPICAYHPPEIQQRASRR